MSLLRIKYGSAFKPVNPTRSHSAHPFSIKSILNLAEDSQESQNKNNINNLSVDSFIDVPTSQAPLVKHFDLPQVEDFMSNRPVCPPWVFATRYSRFGIPAANYANPRRQRKPSKKPKQRPLFSQTQLKQLEEEFVNEKYISKSRRMKLAKEINLTEAQVRTWFQNRRTRWRKEIHGNNGSQCCESSPWKPNCSPQEVTLERSTPTNFMVVRGFCIS